MEISKPFHIIDTTTGKAVETYFSPRYRVVRPAARSGRMQIEPDRFYRALLALMPKAKADTPRNVATYRVLCEAVPVGVAAQDAGVNPSNVSDLATRIENHIRAEDAVKEFE